MSAAAVMAPRRKKLVRCFREKNAICPERLGPKGWRKIAQHGFNPRLRAVFQGRADA